MSGRKRAKEPKRDEITESKYDSEYEQQEIKKQVENVQKEVKNMKKDVGEVKVMLTRMFEKLRLDTSKQDILVAGGHGDVETAKSSEVFSWKEERWILGPPMNKEHWGASSYIYNDQLFVVGGDHSKIIETLSLTAIPLKWIKVRGELPYASQNHQTVVYQQRVYHIGGYKYSTGTDEQRTQSLIGELQPYLPCTIEELYQMPVPRDCHRAEIFEDKVLILGGQKSNEYHDALDSVLEFDPKKQVYQVKEMQPLPYPLTQMATVRWRDQVVVLGGRNKDEKVLNDVFMYDCKTGKITFLPSMLEKRCNCCAVITGNTIVVMGGQIENGEVLNSVEFLIMGSYAAWKYLPAMNKPKSKAIAEILPFTRE